MMLRNGLKPRCSAFLLDCHPESNPGGVSQSTPRHSTQAKPKRHAYFTQDVGCAIGICVDVLIIGSPVQPSLCPFS